MSEIVVKTEDGQEEKDNSKSTELCCGALQTAVGCRRTSEKCWFRHVVLRDLHQDMAARVICPRVPDHCYVGDIVNAVEEISGGEFYAYRGPRSIVIVFRFWEAAQKLIDMHQVSIFLSAMGYGTQVEFIVTSVAFRKWDLGPRTTELPGFTPSRDVEVRLLNRPPTGVNRPPPGVNRPPTGMNRAPGNVQQIRGNGPPIIRVNVPQVGVGRPQVGVNRPHFRTNLPATNGPSVGPGLPPVTVGGAHPPVIMNGPPVTVGPPVNFNGPLVGPPPLGAIRQPVGVLRPPLSNIAVPLPVGYMPVQSPVSSTRSSTPTGTYLTPMNGQGGRSDQSPGVLSDQKLSAQIEELMSLLKSQEENFEKAPDEVPGVGDSDEGDEETASSDAKKLWVAKMRAQKLTHEKPVVRLKVSHVKQLISIKDAHLKEKQRWNERYKCAVGDLKSRLSGAIDGTTAPAEIHAQIVEDLKSGYEEKLAQAKQEVSDMRLSLSAKHKLHVENMREKHEQDIKLLEQRNSIEQGGVRSESRIEIGQLKRKIEAVEKDKRQIERQHNINVKLLSQFSSKEKKISRLQESNTKLLAEIDRLKDVAIRSVQLEDNMQRRAPATLPVRSHHPTQRARPRAKRIPKRPKSSAEITSAGAVPKAKRVKNENAQAKTSSTEPTPTPSTEQREVIEHISAHAYVSGVLWFKLKFAGRPLSDNDWAPASGLCGAEDLINRYWKNPNDITPSQ
eukprot:591549_1